MSQSNNESTAKISRRRVFCCFKCRAAVQHRLSTLLDVPLFHNAKFSASPDRHIDGTAYITNSSDITSLSYQLRTVIFLRILCYRHHVLLLHLTAVFLRCIARIFSVNHSPTPLTCLHSLQSLKHCCTPPHLSAPH